MNFSIEVTPDNAPLRRYQSVTSTNDIARQWAQNGAPHGAVVIADEQTQGRGRRGREWVSPPNCGLYASFIARGDWEISWLTIGAAVAIAQACEDCSGVRTQVKWPNDVLMNSYKIAGILGEAEWKQGRLDFVVIGVGVNVLHELDQLPIRPMVPASSLRLQSERAISLRETEFACLRHLASTCSLLQSGGWEQIRQAWQQRCFGRDELIAVKTEGRNYRGILRGLDEDGALLLATSEGTKRVVVGDISFE